jgi:hypothetical protein
LLAAGTTEVRPYDAALDIGAYEYNPAVGVREGPATTADARAERNFPNPFNGRTTFQFHLPSESDAVLVVYNLLGEQAGWVSLGRLSAGTHRFSWDATGLPSGLYLYRIQAGRTLLSGKLLLEK